MPFRGILRGCTDEKWLMTLTVPVLLRQRTSPYSCNMLNNPDVEMGLFLVKRPPPGISNQIASDIPTSLPSSDRHSASDRSLARASSRWLIYLQVGYTATKIYANR